MLGAVVCAWFSPASAQDFQKDIQPFLNKYCTDCHDAEQEKGHLNLEAFKDDSRFFRDQRIWREVVNQVVSGEMPPVKKKVRPTPAEIEHLQACQRRQGTRQRRRPGSFNRVAAEIQSLQAR